jgi:DNA/RNA endonuclease YhcR with UshA esterase domain
MKNSINLSFVLFLLFLFTAYSQNKIPASEAKNHIGENAIVKGTITEVYHSRGGTCFLDIEGHYPNNLFSAVIFKSDSGKFKGIDSFEGKAVEVKGKIKEYKDKPEIILKSLNQIKIIE